MRNKSRVEETEKKKQCTYSSCPSEITCRYRFIYKGCWEKKKEVIEGFKKSKKKKKTLKQIMVWFS